MGVLETPAAAPPRPQSLALPSNSVKASSHERAAPAQQDRTALDSPAISPAQPHSDVIVAVRNTVKLGLSLLITWSVSIGVRLWLPGLLGPEAVSPVTFAEAFAATWFFAIGLGVDAYVHRELPLRPEHAQDFFGDVLGLRLVMSLVLCASLDIYLQLHDEPMATRQMVWAFGAMQFFLNTGNLLAAMLHASTRVDGLSVANVLSKLLWGVLVGLAVWRGASLVWIPLGQAIGEAFRTVWLWVLARRHVGVRMRFGTGHLLKVVIAGLPFFANAFILNFLGRQAVTMLNFMGLTMEVAWYGQALALAQIITLATPIVFWVLMPLFARSMRRDPEEFREQVCRAAQWVLTLVIPVSLVLFLGAEFCVQVLWGERFAPAVLAIRLLAPVFALYYVSIMGAIILVQLRREWLLVGISAAGLVVNRVLDHVLIARFHTWLGDGGASAGAATALMLSEFVMGGCLLWASRRLAFDKRSLVVLAKTLAVCVLVWLLDRQLRGLMPHLARLALDMVAYAALLVLTGAFRPREALAFARTAMAGRRAGKAAAA